VNTSATAATADLEEFLFGSERNGLAGIRPAVVETQDGR
jgi:hypothetical protein